MLTQFPGDDDNKRTTAASEDPHHNNEVTCADWVKSIFWLCVGALRSSASDLATSVDIYDGKGHTFCFLPYCQHDVLPQGCFVDLVFNMSWAKKHPYTISIKLCTMTHTHLKCFVHLDALTHQAAVFSCCVRVFVCYTVRFIYLLFHWFIQPSAAVCMMRVYICSCCSEHMLCTCSTILMSEWCVHYCVVIGERWQNGRECVACCWHTHTHPFCTQVNQT